jgi:hypothetical protein
MFLKRNIFGKFRQFKNLNNIFNNHFNIENKNFLYYINSSCYTKKKSNKNKNNYENIKHDRGFDEYLKKEEKNKQAKEKKIESIIEKRADSVQCLVLHPVFHEK